MKPLFFFCLVLTSLSCTSLLKSYVEKPEVKVQAFEIHSISWSVAKLDLTLKVDNSNNFDIEISKLSYQVSTLDDKLLAKGELIEATRIQAKSSQHISFPVEVKPAVLVNLLPGILSELPNETPSLELKLDANIDWKTWFASETSRIEQRLRL